MTEPDADEFVEFLSLLTEDAPEGYTPWLFRVEAGSKAPALEYGSWKKEKARLSRHEAVEWMQSGGNVGIAGRPDGPLINVDIDDEDATTIDDLKPTLIARSRSRTGVHAWYFEAPGAEIPNIPTEDAGEVRANWQYVVAPGSYVETDPETVPEAERDAAGYYTVERADPVTSLRLDELPAVFREQDEPDPDEQEILTADQDAFEQQERDGQQSALFDIDAVDVVRKEGGSTNPGDRWSALFHGSDTGHNMSVSSDGLLHCWRHEVAHNGLQALAVLSDYRGDCADVGTGHKRSGAGGSCLHKEDGAHIWHAWKYAKTNGYIPEDDPVPYAALKHLCRDRELCPVSEIPSEYDAEAEDGRLPAYAYDAAIESIEGYDELAPGRNTTDAFGDSGETPTVDELVERAEQTDGEMSNDDLTDGANTGTDDANTQTDVSDSETDEPAGDAAAAATDSFGDPDAYEDPVERQQPSTDGGATTADSGGDSGPETPDSPTTPWDDIYTAYKGASDADERLSPRYEASKQLRAESNWRTVEENDTLWKYDADTGIYRQNGEQQVRTRLDETLREQFKAQEQREIERKLRARTVIKEADFGGPEAMICTENCVVEVSIDGVEVHDHDPDFEFIGRVETEFDPDAECPTFTAFLQDVVTDDTTRRKLQEYAGYCLHHWGLPFHKALFLVGPTASGKSTFLDTIRTMLGNDAVASLTPQQMTSERFGAAELYGAWANIRNDIPADLIENTGQFKELVAGDPVKAEEKFKDPFHFEPTAKHMFSANELPDTETDDRAFYRRILLAAFPTTVPRGERDSKLPQKLEAEHPGILNWALEGLQRLLANGHFSGDRTPAKTEDTWAKWGNSVKRFAKECLEDDRHDDLPTADIFQAYLAYCDDEGIPAETEQQLVTKKLKAEGFDTGRSRVDGKQRRVLHEVTFTGRGEQYRDADPGESSSATGLGGF